MTRKPTLTPWSLIEEEIWLFVMPIPSRNFLVKPAYYCGHNIPADSTIRLLVRKENISTNQREI